MWASDNGSLVRTNDWWQFGCAAVEKENDSIKRSKAVKWSRCSWSVQSRLFSQTFHFWQIITKCIVSLLAKKLNCFYFLSFTEVNMCSYFYDMYTYFFSSSSQVILPILNKRHRLQVLATEEWNTLLYSCVFCFTFLACSLVTRFPRRHYQSNVLDTLWI